MGAFSTRVEGRPSHRLKRFRAESVAARPRAVRAPERATAAGSKNRRGGDSYYEEPPSYLSEPTAEFKEAEKARAAYREKQAKFRGIWDPVRAARKHLDVASSARVGRRPAALSRIEPRR